jgi:transposase InsO family protein
MPWKWGTVMDSRHEFVRLAGEGDVGIAELCRRFGISRQTGYLYLKRYKADGDAGLADRSSRPLNSLKRCAPELETCIVALRASHPRWGGRKLARRLRDLGVEGVPAASTVTEVLRRRGKLDPGESERHLATQRFERSAPNGLWQMDFKGHFAMDRGRCHPLVPRPDRGMLDDHSRYSIGVIACDNETEQTVKTHLTDLFHRHGLPSAMLADNGSRWGGSGAPGYTALEAWLMRVGIRLYHGRARHPQTQGERGAVPQHAGCGVAAA